MSFVDETISQTATLFTQQSYTFAKLERVLPMKVSSSFLPFAALFVLSGNVLGNAQSVPCYAITRNPLVLEALLDSHSQDTDSDLEDDTINAAQLEHLQFTPIVIQPGDALYLEYRGRDFTVDANFASGERTAFDSSPKGSYEQWRKGILPLDMFREALSQRLIRLRATAKNLNQVLFRNVKIIRAGKPVFEFAKLVSYGKPQVKTTVDRQLPCVGFEDVPANGNPAAVSYSFANPAPFRNFSGGLTQPMLPAFPMMMMQSTTTGTDPNHFKFTGKELDDETGLYNYGARYYSPALGRYMTPDWSAMPVPIPYADLSNPQTLNLYNYGRNNPTTLADKDGHCPGDDCKKVQVTVTAPPVNVVENQPAGNDYHTGVGTTAVVTFTDKKGHPLAGVKVTENPKTRDNLTGQPIPNKQNPEPVATSAQGTIKDNVTGTLRSDPQPHDATPEDIQAVKDAANSLPYNRTTDQTLTFSVDRSNCQCTYSETMSNVDSKGNLNTQSNSNGLNFTYTNTTPVVQKVDPKKEPK
jgi:RHS repeat-associated protein